MLENSVKDQVSSCALILGDGDYLRDMVIENGMSSVKEKYKKNFLKVIVKAGTASGAIGVLLEIAFQLRISCQSVQNFSLLFSNIILAFRVRK